MVVIYYCNVSLLCYNLLKENFMNTFKTKIQLDIIGDAFGVKAGSGEIELTWNLELEMREYGVKGFVVSVPDQAVNCEVERYDEETDEEITETETIELKDVKVELDEIKGMVVPIRLELWQGRAKLEFV